MAGDEESATPRVGRRLAKLDEKNLAPESTAFARYLRGLHARSGLTSQRLESELGMAAGGLSRYLNGGRLPPLKWLRRFQDWVEKNTEIGLTSEERDAGRDLLYAAGKVKNILVAHEVELESLDHKLAERITVVEHNINEIQDQLAEERATREKDHAKVAELEEQLEQLRELAKILQAERNAFSTIADAVAAPGPVMDVVPQEDGPPPRIWGTVPLRNPDFVGRTELLHALRQQLVPLNGTPIRPQVLHGLGGVGKSQLVAEYVYRHAGDYDLVWWTPSEHPTTIRSSFVDLAKRLGIKASSAESAVPAVLEALRSADIQRRWILVFDNAESPDAVRSFLPIGAGHVIITSRNPFWDGVARPLEVGLFTRAESIELLRLRRVGADVDVLAETLGDLPVALDGMGSWIGQTGTSVSEYLQLLAEDSSQLLSTGLSIDYELPVAAVWNVPLNRLKNDSRYGLEILRLCAFFAPGPIARGLVFAAAQVAVPETVAPGSVGLRNAVRELTRYSLVKTDRHDDTLSLHPLLQIVVRDQMETEQREQARHAVHTALAANDPGDPDEPANWPRYAMLLPHTIHSKAVDCQAPETDRLVENLVRFLLATGNTDTARTLAEQALSAREDQNDDVADAMRQYVDTARLRLGEAGEP